MSPVPHGTDFDDLEVWFLTGSQHLYGEETLDLVEEHAREVAAGLDDDDRIPVSIEFKSVLTTGDAIESVVREANASEDCIGLITWMHTFSPAKMWIRGLQALDVPFVHLHTQFNRELPWDEIDMDFMNANQSAHGGREFGHIVSRLDIDRKVVVGHWEDDDVREQLGTWARAAAARHELQGAKIARFGDNMRDVAVTEGDKVSAQMAFGASVDGYGLGDLVAFVEDVTESEIDDLLEEYDRQYELAAELQADGDRRDSLREAARIELGIRAFLEDGEFVGFTTTFENLTGLSQLPGLAVQRLMADGYGFGPEGDWKSALLTRAMKVMGQGLNGGTSLMEHYTYDLTEGDEKVLGAHMLEICESIAGEQPRLEIHPLDIGGKADPVRAVFDADTGPAINASLVDMGDRFRLITNDVESVGPDEPLPELPVARAVWKPEPNFETAIEAWIKAGGAHHTGYSQAVTSEHLEDFASMTGIEHLHVGADTDIADVERKLS
ncbi:L-arabinose isomerase [Halorhabdus sp. SVX81]|uniref:L-arabinose isomerase n=1 Tax=Halorhabdus sp. SVX81 TaxID=2978283 RepID=UPI0023DC7EE8|nr:L-arabinose isomerase [Halorhabdus sp. SVX81]WEL16640.1 L-arabinose isomerase [Halorhabdus sp. SVX81]